MKTSQNRYVKKLLSLSILLLLALSLINTFNVNITRVSAVDSPYVKVVPESITEPRKEIGETVTVGIYTDYGVAQDYSEWDATSYQFTMFYDASVLNGVEVTNGVFIVDGSATFLAGPFDNTAGELSLTMGFYKKEEVTSMYRDWPWNGTLAYVTFNVTGYGASYITLGDDTKLKGWNFTTSKEYNIIDAESMPTHIQHGYFDNRFQNDVAVVSVTAPEKAPVGDLVPISVEVKNIGKLSEVANVTISYDTTYIDSQNVTLAAGESEIVSFSWNTTGVAQRIYTINATATIAVDDDPADNWNTLTIFIVEHNLAVVSVTAPEKAPVGESVPINVTVANVGASAEVANVTISYDSTFIGFNDTVELPVQSSAVVLFSWNTTGVAQGIYTINATVTIRPRNGMDTWPGDGVKTSFFTTGKPVVPDSEKVYVNQTLMTKPTNYTIAYDTGNITFSTAPGVGAEINATYLYPVDLFQTDNWNTTTILIVEHDVAIISLDAPAEAPVGDPVFINATVANIGSSEENVTLTFSYVYEHPSEPPPTVIDARNFTLIPGAITTASFNWNTTGLDAKYPYKINATATIPLDDDHTDNSKTSKIKLTSHDIEVLSLTRSPYSVFVGELIHIEVNVRNVGDYNEAFNVKVSYDTSIITEFQQIKLIPENSTILSYNWNTTGVASGSYKMKAEAVLAKDAKPDNNLKIRDIFINPPLGTIAGTVTDASTDLPIEGATVTANGYSTTTDADGHYNITDVLAGTYTVTASAAGYESSSQTDVAVVAGETTTLNFTLTPLPTTGTIAGTVKDSSTGKPIADAIVTANGMSATTDSSGAYTISDVPAGTYTVTASAAGYEESSQTDVIVIAGETTTVSFELTPAQPLNILLYVGVAAAAIITILGIAFYFLRIRKPT